MAHFSVEMYALPASLLSSNQHVHSPAMPMTPFPASASSPSASPDPLWSISRSRGASDPAGRPSWRQQPAHRSEEHTSELQSLMRISYAVFCLKKQRTHNYTYYIVYLPLHLTY